MSDAARPHPCAILRRWPALVGLSLLLLACDDADGPAGGDVGDCAAVARQCPLGSNPVVGAQAETQCTTAVGGIVSDGTGQASAQCIGAGSCRVLCQFQVPCRCGVAMVGPEGVICAPCEGAAACGDGVCSGGETPQSCAVDCGATCGADERRCDGTTLQVCSLQGRWDDLRCPDGELCDAADGEARCVPDPGVIRADAGVDADMGPAQGGRIIEGDAPWPDVEPALRGSTPMSTVLQPLPDLFMGGLGGTLGSTGGALHWRLLSGTDQIQAIGTRGRATVAFDGQLTETRAFTADAEQFCQDYARCSNSAPPADCAAFVAQQRESWGDSRLQCMADRIRDAEDPDACMVLFFGEGCDGHTLLHPDARAFAPAPSVRQGARVAGPAADNVPVAVVVDVDEDSSYAFEPVGEFRLREKLSFSADGRVVAVVAYNLQDEVVVIWQVDAGTRAAILPLSGAINRAIALSPDGRVLARVVDRSGDDAQDGTIALWDTQSEARIFSIRPPENGSFGNLLTLSPDGRTLAVFVRPRNEVELWDLRAREKLHTLVFAPETIPDALQFSPDGALLEIRYVNFERALTLWRVDAGQRFFTEPAARAAFADDGRILVVHDDIGRDGVGLIADP